MTYQNPTLVLLLWRHHAWTTLSIDSDSGTQQIKIKNFILKIKIAKRDFGCKEHLKCVLFHSGGIWRCYEPRQFLHIPKLLLIRKIVSNYHQLKFGAYSTSTHNYWNFSKYVNCSQNLTFQIFLVHHNFYHTKHGNSLASEGVEPGILVNHSRTDDKSKQT